MWTAENTYQMIKQILYNCEADCTVLNRKPQIISGGGAHPLHPPPRSAPAERGPRLILTLISTSWFGAISTELSRFPPIWLIKIKKKSLKNNFQWSSSFACSVFFLSFSFLFLVRFSSLFFLFFSFLFFFYWNNNNYKLRSRSPSKIVCESNDLCTDH